MNRFGAYSKPRLRLLGHTEGLEWLAPTKRGREKEGDPMPRLDHPLLLGVLLLIALSATPGPMSTSSSP